MADDPQMADDPHIWLMDPMNNRDSINKLS